jgi:hypothetical protein
VPNSFRRRRRAGLIGGVTVLAASVFTLSLTGLTPAVASASAPGNNIIIASGSQTAYALMAGFDDLFNASQGCNEIAQTGETQALNYNCPSGSSITTADNEAVNDTGENPVNDVVVQEPPLGGTNGLKQLEGQTPVLCTPSNTTCTSSAPINFATTVRTPLPSDPVGLNFVTYALDGISWFHFTKVNGKATPSSTITNLTITDLLKIWEGPAAGGYSNWDQIPGYTAKSAPICVYVTNTGSGLYSLFQSDIGIPALNSYVNSNPSLTGCDVPSGQTYATSHTIEQNEDGQIISNGDEKNAIFFFSYGRFEQECHTGTKVCGGTKAPGTSTPVLGEIGGEALTPANILSGAWPTDVYLSTVYSNGAGAYPVASQATLNYASEDGFLCNPQTSGGNDIIDPTTGVWYRTEIQNLISAEYFEALPLGPEGAVDTPASLNSPYTQAGQTSGTDPQGYCEVATTDGN